MAALKSIININRENIIIYTAGNNAVKITLSEKAVDDLEVKDESQLKKEIVKVILAEKLKPNNAVIALGDEVLFTKSTTIKDEAKREKAISDFLSEIPFQPQRIVHKTFNTSKGVQIVATNSNLYTKCMNIFRELGWKIKYVVPITIFGNINAENIRALLADKTKLSTANLHTFDVKEIKSEIKIGAGIALTAIIALGAYIFISNATITSPQAPVELITPVVEETIELPDPEPVMEVPLPARSEIKIQILNGSGIAGQASLTQEKLNGAGFENIEIGNADTQDYTETTVTYSDAVPEEYLEEITNLLKENYENILESSLQKDVTITYDIVIITGDLITSN